MWAVYFPHLSMCNKNNRSLVIHHLESQNSNIGLAWIYLNHKETETQTPVNLLASFLKQLTFGLKSVPSTVQELYQYHHGRQTRPNSDELIKAFPSVIAGYSKVYMMIDAFDEYPEDQRHVLLKYLATIANTVNLLITSRPHVNLGSFLSKVQTLDIKAIDNDIRLLVDSQISKSPRLSKHV